MISQPSDLDDGHKSAFDLLHPEIQRWIYDQEWAELRSVQAKSILAIQTSEADVLLAAATAAGKTEAAFLPILSSIAEKPGGSFQAIYIGPLKALINDQFGRLEDICKRVNIPIAKWHGDVQDSMKRHARERPSGILLITPESLEALFMRRPQYIDRMFGKVRFVVIDEIHTFLSTERGLQLSSLLRRLECATQSSPRRIGLSATIGDLSLAAQWLRPERSDQVHLVNDTSNPAGIQLQIRGAVMPSRKDTASTPKAEKKSDTSAKDIALRSIADHLYSVLRTKGNNLVFASSRRDVEQVADLLRVASEAADVENEFFPHHGNLSRLVRESLEERLKEGDKPTTAIATSTLELGVDIGSIESIAHIGAPRSIAALKQRIGRSGRRAGKPQVLRLYVMERELDEKSSLMDRLRTEAIQSVASIRLMLAGWIEPPLSLRQNLSTLLHQILSLIVERGGISHSTLTQILCAPGPFESISLNTVNALLDSMRTMTPALIEQAQDGTIMLGEEGEKLCDGYEFFAVFKTTDEFRIVAGGKTLGTVSIINAFGPDDYIVFAGQRWKVLSVDDRSKTVEVESAPAGRAPIFEGGEPAPLHDKFIAEIRSTYLAGECPAFLNSVAKQFCSDGLEEFRKVGLAEKTVIEADNSVYLFPWRGTASLDSLRLALKKNGVPSDQSSIALRVPYNRENDLRTALEQLATSENLVGADLAEMDENIERSKYDNLVPRELLREAAAIDRLNAQSVPLMAQELLGDFGR